MKATELISALQELVDTHGDLPVTVYDGLDPVDRTTLTSLELSFKRYYDESRSVCMWKGDKNIFLS